MKSWHEIKWWIINKFSDSNEEELEELIWVDKDIVKGEVIDWEHVDSVKYKLDKVLTKHEIVIDMEVPKEQVVSCQQIVKSLER